MSSELTRAQNRPKEGHLSGSEARDSGWRNLVRSVRALAASFTPSVVLDLRSWVDLVVPTVIWLVLIATPGDARFWAGALIAESWGLLGAVNSNEGLEAGRVR